MEALEQHLSSQEISKFYRAAFSGAGLQKNVLDRLSETVMCSDDSIDLTEILNELGPNDFIEIPPLFVKSWYRNYYIFFSKFIEPVLFDRASLQKVMKFVKKLSFVKYDSFRLVSAAFVSSALTVILNVLLAQNQNLTEEEKRILSKLFSFSWGVWRTLQSDVSALIRKGIFKCLLKWCESSQIVKLLLEKKELLPLSFSLGLHDESKLIVITVLQCWKLVLQVNGCTENKIALFMDNEHQLNMILHLSDLHSTLYLSVAVNTLDEIGWEMASNETFDKLAELLLHSNRELAVKSALIILKHKLKLDSSSDPQFILRALVDFFVRKFDDIHLSELFMDSLSDAIGDLVTIKDWCQYLKALNGGNDTMHAVAANQFYFFALRKVKGYIPASRAIALRTLSPPDQIDGEYRTSLPSDFAVHWCDIISGGKFHGKEAYIPLLKVIGLMSHPHPDTEDQVLLMVLRELMKLMFNSESRLFYTAVESFSALFQEKTSVSLPKEIIEYFDWFIVLFEYIIDMNFTQEISYYLISTLKVLINAQADSYFTLKCYSHIVYECAVIHFSSVPRFRDEKKSYCWKSIMIVSTAFYLNNAQLKLFFKKRNEFNSTELYLSALYSLELIKTYITTAPSLEHYCWVFNQFTKYLISSFHVLKVFLSEQEFFNLIHSESLNFIYECIEFFCKVVLHFNFTGRKDFHSYGIVTATANLFQEVLFPLASYINLFSVKRSIDDNRILLGGFNSFLQTFNNDDMILDNCARNLVWSCLNYHQMLPAFNTIFHLNNSEIYCIQLFEVEDVHINHEEFLLMVLNYFIDFYLKTRTDIIISCLYSILPSIPENKLLRFIDHLSNITLDENLNTFYTYLKSHADSLLL